MHSTFKKLICVKINRYMRKLKSFFKGIVEIKGGEYLLFNDKVYRFDNEGNYEEVSKIK